VATASAPSLHTTGEAPADVDVLRQVKFEGEVWCLVRYEGSQTGWFTMASLIAAGNMVPTYSEGPHDPEALLTEIQTVLRLTPQDNIVEFLSNLVESNYESKVSSLNDSSLLEGTDDPPKPSQNS
jgi:hypothetical protein